jgi:hypothetical protein
MVANKLNKKLDIGTPQDNKLSLTRQNSPRQSKEGGPPGRFRSKSPYI